MRLQDRFGIALIALGLLLAGMVGAGLYQDLLQPSVFAEERTVPKTDQQIVNENFQHLHQRNQELEQRIVLLEREVGRLQRAVYYKPQTWAPSAPLLPRAVEKGR